MNQSISRLGVKDMVLCALFTALIAIGAFIRIPVPVVPFTLQLLFTMLAGLFLGPRLGALSSLLYMVIGLIGVPVFTEGGGPMYILKPSFGYIVGFVVGSYVTGLIAHKVAKPSFKRILWANLAGLLVVYAMGMSYLWMIKTLYLGTGITMYNLVLYCFVLIVPGDLVLCVLATIVYKRMVNAGIRII